MTSNAAHDTPLDTAAKLVADFEEDEIDYEGLGANYPLHINMTAGSLAGITEHAVMFPVDLVRTRMQVLTNNPAAKYTGVTEALTRISSVEGFKGLWKGIASVILGAGPAHALYFGTYEIVKEHTGGNRSGLQLASTGFAGASATIASDAFMNPFDVIKQRMQLQGNHFRSVFQCASELYKAEGLRTFYVSYPTTLTMTIPFTAIQFATYEWAKKLLNPRDSYSPTTHAVAGGLAGAAAAALTNPLDVAKTVLQTRGCSSDPEIRNVNSMWSAFKLIKQKEGFHGFWRGLSPRIVTHVPSNALCWLQGSA
ncbi:Fe(2+) transporter [Malassezia vespertilionis]|uniref:Fe(2+) transporter n=1 Tax=Malassezia vespertilionis TaxID=2020962 RepID=UPI0024B18128|nr:Fe(2+) transporter [Malassezia vespertilionis]WFD06395.1 Fe(2+) transporter [Malassezia vespertilionis]